MKLPGIWSGKNLVIGSAESDKYRFSSERKSRHPTSHSRCSIRRFHFQCPVSYFIILSIFDKAASLPRMEGTVHTDGTINKEDGQGLFEFGSSQHQREYPKDHYSKGKEAYHEGKLHSHNPLDSSKYQCDFGLDSMLVVQTLISNLTEDQRSIANKLEAEEKHVCR